MNFLDKLQVKIITVIVLTMVLSTGVVIGLLIYHLHYQSNQQAQNMSSMIIEIARKSIITFKQWDMRLFKTFLKTTMEIEDIKDINIIRGTSFDKQSGADLKKSAKDDLAREVFRTGEAQEKVEQVNGERIYRRIVPLIATSECLPCHQIAENDILGAASISLSLNKFDTMHQSIKTDLIIAFSILIIVVSAILYLLFRRSIINPLKEMITTIRKVTRGELTQRLKAKAKDEFGLLARAINEMVQSLSTIVSKIREVINQTSATAAQIAAATQEQEKGTSAQAASVNEITATIEQLNSSAKLVNQKSESVLQLSQETLNVTFDGQKAVQNSIEEMNTIRDKVEHIAEQILNLSDQAQQIGSIIKTVNDIAQKTDMLAINAAIEAARAGEHGKGFAVVADEIRKLSDQSQKATAQITELIQEIQSATNSSVLATEEGSRSVKEGSKRILEAGDTISLVTTSIKETVDSVQEIVLASRQQSLANNHVAQEMSTINTRMKQSAASVKQTLLAAEALDILGHDLQEMIKQFQV